MTPVTIILITTIVIVALWIGYSLGKYYGKLSADHAWEREIPKIREDATKRSRAVIGGQFSEQLAPFLPNFPWKPTEARFIGKPVDFLIFKGLDEKTIEEVIFVEVKSGGSRLNTSEKSLRNAIKEKRVSWEEYRIPEEITK